VIVFIICATVFIIFVHVFLSELRNAIDAKLPIVIASIRHSILAKIQKEARSDGRRLLRQLAPKFATVMSAASMHRKLSGFDG
jgi:hypothetical protein